MLILIGLMAWYQVVPQGRLSFYLCLWALPCSLLCL